MVSSASSRSMSRTSCLVSAMSDGLACAMVTPMPPVISVSHLTKTYASGLAALRDVNLEIRKGEIFALLGPNGAGKTTLINVICGIVTASSGEVLADGHDIAREYRIARSKIGLVPQELSTDASRASGPPSPSAAGCSGGRPTLPWSSGC